MSRLNLPPILALPIYNPQCGAAHQAGMRERDRQIAKALRERAKWHEQMSAHLLREDHNRPLHNHAGRECKLLAAELDPDTKEKP